MKFTMPRMIRPCHSEFIELINVVPVPSTWQLDARGRDLDYTFPGGHELPANGFVIACEDPAIIQSKWAVSGAGVFNWNAGSLSAALCFAPQWRGHVTLRDASGEEVDEVDFDLGFPWPTVGDPPNYSIELINPGLIIHRAGTGGVLTAARRTCNRSPIFRRAALRGIIARRLSEASNPNDAWRAIGFVEDASWLASATGAPVRLR